ncbi:HIV Tat-specific factor 1 [Anopheles funestus]|uniref:HIV Tat-specific factor 1 n=1 Tax=Anopheles funestus TaxID=62324 RepID=UPI0020C6EC57|nr:HIV Tat-specific factor 1 [Anopheles funestus]XP_049292871.1 HIV Tat-specific factor 1 [Anopheles funestus]
MSSGESDSSESPNVSATPTMSSRETAANVMLTDSENTNNENRVIEMESNPGAEDTDAAPSGKVEQADEPTTEPTSSASDEKEIDEPGKEKQPDETGASKTGKDQHAEHVTYNETGEAIYTDPATKFQYRWCKEKSEWVPLDGTVPSGTAGETPSDNPYENEHYRWCHEKKEWIPKQETPTETEFYRWDEKAQKWVPKQQQQPTSEEDREYGYEDGVHTYKDKDGAVYFWDDERKAWFPKVDDDFMAMYQLNYGFIDNTSSGSVPAVAGRVTTGEGSTAARQFPGRNIDEDDVDEQDEAQRALPKGKKRKAPPEPPKWFDMAPEHNTKVYVSNLPMDISEEEFGEVMSKCGMVMKDPKTHKLKLKLYREADGTLKGDGLCHYIKIESVDLALKILDNYDVRGHKIKVQRAEFQMRGEYNPTLKPKMRKKEKERLKKMQESLFDWRPEKMRGERSKHERIVIIKNLFEPSLFDREVHLLLEYQNDLREECAKCGTVRRVLLYDRHPEGVAQITMGDPEEADLVVQMMNGRYFGQRQLTAAIWDGRTKYRIAETDADIDKRRGNWEEFLETDDGGEKGKVAEQEKDDDAPPSTTKASPEMKLDDQEEQLPAVESETIVEKTEMKEDEGEGKEMEVKDPEPV